MKKRKEMEERERNVLDDPHNNILSQVCWPRCSQRARPICSHHPPLSLSPSSLPLLFSLSLVVPFVQFIHCASGVTRARVNRENGRRTEEEGRRKGGGREEGKRKNRPWQQIGITAHVTGCTVTVSVPFSNRIAASLRSRVLTIQQNRTFLLLSLSMFRDFSPGDSVLFPFHKHPRMDLSFSRSCARARVYTRISLERIESI